VYRAAEYYASKVGKPMLVVGAPKGAHGCGDMNIDIVDSNECPSFIQADVEDLYMFHDTQFGSCFCGHVLEHVNDIEKAFNEMNRVSDKVFIAHPPWHSLTAYLDPTHKWIIYSAPPISDYLEYKKI